MTKAKCECGAQLILAIDCTLYIPTGVQTLQEIKDTLCDLNQGHFEFTQPGEEWIRVFCDQCQKYSTLEEIDEVLLEDDAVSTMFERFKYPA